MTSQNPRLISDERLTDPPSGQSIAGDANVWHLWSGSALPEPLDPPSRGAKRTIGRSEANVPPVPGVRRAVELQRRATWYSSSGRRVARRGPPRSHRKETRAACWSSAHERSSSSGRLLWRRAFPSSHLMRRLVVCTFCFQPFLSTFKRVSTLTTLRRKSVDLPAGLAACSERSPGRKDFPAITMAAVAAINRHERR